MTESALPMIRPMTLAELLDRAIRLYRQNFFKFIGIFAIPYIPLTLIQYGLSFFTTTSMVTAAGQGNVPPEELIFSPAWLAGISGTFIVAFVQFIIVQGVATAALTRAVANNYTGKPVGILDSYRTLSNSWLKLVAALILVFFLVLILSVWMIIPCVGWFSGPGILFFIGLVVSPLVAPIIALENNGILASIRRAWDLGRSRFWWLVGCALVLAFFGWLVVTGPVLLINWILQFVTLTLDLDYQMQMAISSVVQALITIFTSLLYIPLKLTVMTVVYFDLRARSEGLDLALQMPASTNTENQVIGLPEISTTSSTPLITGIDLGRFALLSLAGMAIYGIFLLVIIGMMGAMTAGLGL
jgi:hypothetical protein